MVVGNPPYNVGRGNRCAEKHVRKALSMSPVVGMLLKFKFMKSVVRIPFWKDHPAAKVVLFGDRPQFNKEGKKKLTAAFPYAFFIWDSEWQGKAKLELAYWRH